MKRKDNVLNLVEFHLAFLKLFAIKTNTRTRKLLKIAEISRICNKKWKGNN